MKIDQNGMSSTMELTKIEKDKFPKSMFEVPGDYEEKTNGLNSIFGK